MSSCVWLRCFYRLPAIIVATVLVVWGTAFELAASQKIAEPVRLRLLSYNIHHAEGTDGKLDLERIARVIRSVQPDLVALQEVDQNVGRTGNINQPEELAHLTGLNLAFGANIKLQGGHYGNAVLSRYSVVSSRNHLLPVVDNGEQRGVLAVEVDIHSVERPLLLLATHFDHRRDPKERIQSAKVVNSLVPKDRQIAVLMGDMNDIIGSKSIDILDTAWNRTSRKSMPTIPVEKPSRQIDFIFTRPASRWKVLETRVLDEAIASDHRPIFSQVELQSE